MNEQIREQLSALMDGELDGHQTRFLLAGADADLVQRWSRYQFAAQVLRREGPRPLRAGFAEAVMAAVAPLPQRPSLPRRVVHWGAGGALAASVAVMALLVTRPAGEPAGVAPPPLVRATAPAPGSPAIAVAPAAATTTTFGRGEVSPPLLFPTPPLDAAPASYGMETLLVPALDARARHPQASAPSVLLLTPVERNGAEAAGRAAH